MLQHFSKAPVVGEPGELQGEDSEWCDDLWTCLLCPGHCWTQPGSLALVPSGVDHTREKCHTLTASGILRLFFGLTCLFYRR